MISATNNKVQWEFRGKRMIPVGMFRKDSQKEARNRYLINMLKLASSFLLVPKDWIFEKQTLVEV